MNNPIDLIKEDENINPEFREVFKHNVILPHCKRCGELITEENRLLTAEFDGGVQIDFGCSKCIERPIEELDLSEFRNASIPEFQDEFKEEFNKYRKIIIEEEKKRGNL